VLVEFWGVWSGPSRAVAPLVLAAASEFAGRLKVVQVDIELGYTIAGRLGVHSVPALAVVHGTETIAVREGVLSGDDLRAWLDECLSEVGARR
jgi:thioredoxin-like negative regulator of GroEL